MNAAQHLGLNGHAGRSGQSAASAPAPATAPVGSWRLLAGWAETGRAETYAEHLRRFGPLPLKHFHGSAGRQQLIEVVGAAGLRGRGGAAFPTGRKLAAVAANRGRAIVLGNGCEGEPSSRKDQILVEYAPHLVIEGAIVAAHATHADEIYLCVHAEAAGGPAGLAGRLAEAAGDHRTKVNIRIVEVPGGFVASEESALVNFLQTGDARPTSKPPRAFERGVKGRPTYVGNFETLAHLALVARFGSDWFRTVGTASSPGSALVTMGGAVRNAGVVEVPYGMTVDELVESAGGATEELQAYLVGGFAGHWMPAASAGSTPFTHEDLGAAGAGVGVGAVIALPAAACGIVETAHVLAYLAGESAAQCGPCMFGLPAIASDFAALASAATVRDVLVQRRIERRLDEIAGRGACAHPDGAIRLAETALRVFEVDVRSHLAGRPCPAAIRPPRLRLPGDRRSAAASR